MSSEPGARGETRVGAPADPEPESSTASPFSEKGFYLGELRDRTLGIVARGRDVASPAVLVPVLRELEANRTRVVLIGDAQPALEAWAAGSVLPLGDLRSLPGRVWRSLGPSRRVAVLTPPAAPFPACCGEIAVALGIGKLVWIDPGGGLRGEQDRRDSFIDARELDERIADTPDRRELLVEVQRLLESGIAAVNLCTLEGIGDELFTYDGSGTLFTREGYVHVHRLGLDDFDAAADLIARGVSEGYLAPRSPEEIERVLASGFGAFVGGNHLAGIGTLLESPDVGAAEIGSLYTLTRFVGEGVGGHLVRHALDRARESGCAFVFACTTSDRVVAFFERNGFRKAEPAEIPDAKWRDYDPARRRSVRCLRHDLD